jgi:hypothetical protein
VIQLFSGEGLLILDELCRTYYAGHGGEVEDCLALMNTEEKPIRVKVYSKDFTFNLKENLLFPEPGLLKRSNAPWIKVNYFHLEIPPFSVCPFKFSLSVPNDSSLKGSYWSVLMFESTETPRLLSSPDGTEVQAIKRYAVQLLTHVGQEARYDFRILDKRVERFINQKKLAIDLENTGELSIKLIPAVEVFDENGALLYSFLGEKKLLHPSCSSKFEIDISPVPKGLYKMRLFLKDGEKNLFSTDYHLEIPEML